MRDMQWYERQAYNAWKRLTPEDKSFLTEEEIQIKITAKSIQDIYAKGAQYVRSQMKNKKYKGTLAYNLLKGAVSGQSRAQRLGTKKEIFEMFRKEKPSVYATYNSYMYRQGYSSANYFYNNGEVEYESGSWRSVYLELPGRLYSLLYVRYNYSTGEVEASLTKTLEYSDKIIAREKKKKKLSRK